MMSYSRVLKSQKIDIWVKSIDIKNDIWVNSIFMSEKLLFKS